MNAHHISKSRAKCHFAASHGKSAVSSRPKSYIKRKTYKSRFVITTDFTDFEEIAVVIGRIGREMAVESCRIVEKGMFILKILSETVKRLSPPLFDFD